MSFPISGWSSGSIVFRPTRLIGRAGRTRTTRTSILATGIAHRPCLLTRSNRPSDQGLAGGSGVQFGPPTRQPPKEIIYANLIRIQTHRSFLRRPLGSGDVELHHPPAGSR